MSTENPKDGTNPFADSFSLQLSGLGGDPFPTAQFTVSKKKLYDFRANWRQSYYFWNQNDNVVLPIAAAGARAFPRGLPTNHDWTTVRKFGSVDFTLHATNNLRFNFDYYRPSDEGIAAHDSLAGFPWLARHFGALSPEPIRITLFAPLTDDTNRFTGGVDYAWKTWSFHYSIGYQTFTENIEFEQRFVAGTQHQSRASSDAGAADQFVLVAIPPADHADQRIFLPRQAAAETRMARRIYLLPLSGTDHVRPGI